jgi:hypothetical protein
MNQLRHCPFCGVHPEKFGVSGAYTIEHKPDCFLRQLKVIFEDRVAEWNAREPDWERKWGELVETTATRVAQAGKP